MGLCIFSNANQVAEIIASASRMPRSGRIAEMFTDSSDAFQLIGNFYQPSLIADDRPYGERSILGRSCRNLLFDADMFLGGLK